jgi:amino acid transporter
VKTLVINCSGPYDIDTLDVVDEEPIVESTEQKPAANRLGGSRKLTLVDAIAQSIGFMGPVFSIAFLVPLLVGVTSASGKGAGAAAPLSTLIAAIGVLGLGWIVAEYAKRIHAAGSLYDYVTDGLGNKVGGAAGGLYYVGILALGAGILVLIGGTIYDTILGEFNKEPIPRAAWDIILLAIVAAVLYLGVALSTRAQLVLALVSITVVLIFSVYVIVKVGSANHVDRGFRPSSSPTGWTGVMFGVLYGVLLFTGFETAANLGEETAHPKRDIPRAVLISVLVVSGFYVLGCYAQITGFHYSIDAIGKNAGAPLFGLAGPTSGGGYGSVAIRRLLELVVILDMLAVLIGCSVASSRGFFAMARDRRLPKAMGRISRRGTPLVAGMVVVALYFVTILISHLWTGLVALPDVPHYAAVFTWCSTFGGFALSVIYLLMAVGAVRGLSGEPGYRAKVVVAAIVGGAVTAAAIFGSIYKVSKPLIYAPWAALIIFAIGLVLAFLRPEPVRVDSPFEALTDTERGPIKI